MTQPYTLSQSPDSELVHMYCSECGRPALFEYWEYASDYGDEEAWPGLEMDHDTLGCPHCRQVVPITEWIEGRPPDVPPQPTPKRKKNSRKQKELFT